MNCKGKFLRMQESKLSWKLFKVIEQNVPPKQLTDTGDLQLLLRQSLVFHWLFFSIIPMMTIVTWEETSRFKT